MKRYKRTKEVNAGKIISMEPDFDAIRETPPGSSLGTVLTLEGNERVKVPYKYMEKNMPCVGGYFVVCVDDESEHYIEAKVFEKQYSRTNDVHVDPNTITGGG